MKRLHIESHHSEEELVALEKRERDAEVRERLRAIRLLCYSGMSKTKVCAILGRGRTTLLEWCHRYNRDGVAGLERRENPGGRKPLCDEVGRDVLEELLSHPPDDGGLWSGPKLSRWLAKKLGRPVGETQGWRTLRRLGYSLQVPKPRNRHADAARQAAFKK